ncbi:hypothetical protein SDC9_119067 [bioreactor metagenome]|uniref:Uncharacterized protein n=1 Tax=bioreactor metagenome TaxID=1076179 RepID=A0A645C999_9ZZZZ
MSAQSICLGASSFLCFSLQYLRYLLSSTLLVNGLGGRANVLPSIHSRSTLKTHYRWKHPSDVAIVARFKKEGIVPIAGVRHHHDHRYMTREQEEVFLGELEDIGAAGQVIETRAIHWAYEERVGHPVTRNMIYFLLQRHQ